MYERKYIKDGYEVTETYQSWYEVWWEGWMMSGVYFICGVVGFFVTPFMAIRSLWYPNCVRSQGHKHHVQQLDDETGRHDGV